MSERETLYYPVKELKDNLPKADKLPDVLELTRLLATNDVALIYPTGDILLCCLQVSDYFSVGSLKHLTVCYGRYSQDETADVEDKWTLLQGEFFLQTNYRAAAVSLLQRFESENPSRFTGHGDTPERIWAVQNNTLAFKNHYTYLECMVEPFSKKVFGPKGNEVWNNGVIAAHGDKAYGYKSDFKKADISFGRGVLLYLLTYSSEFKDRPKHESIDWIIERYPHYLPIIEETEAEVLALFKEETNHGQS